MARKALEISTEHCLIDQQDKTLIITLNRPERKNALSPAMLMGMYRAWRHLDENEELLCAILTGTGETFCAGMDLKQGHEPTDDQAGKELLETMKSVPDLHWQSLLRNNRPSKPIILAVEGYALAGGTEILQGTDIRVAAEDAVFGVTEVMRGLYPMGGSAVRLRRQIPYCLAAEMLLLGEHFSAKQALEFGLINRVVPKGKALEEALSIAETLSACGPLSVRAIMRTLREIDECYSDTSAMTEVDKIGWPVIQSKDAKEGMRAFSEKRTPKYRGE
jgi:enoyl-CoA hydratase